MPSSKVFLGLTLSLFILGCSTESQKKKDFVLNGPHDFEQSGNFQVNTFRVTSSERMEANSFDFTSRKIFNFEACLVDQLNAPIGMPNLQFAVEDEQGNREIVVTDRRGCIVWSETPAFSYLLDETFFRFVRIVRSQNLYRGFVRLEAAFNPWNDGASALIDTRYQRLPVGVTLQDMSPQQRGLKNAHFRTMGASNLRVNLRNASFRFMGADYPRYEVSPMLDLTVAHKYLVRLSPTVIRRTLRKTVVPEALNTGRLKAVLVILKEDQNESTQYSARNVVASVEFEDELVVGDLVATISIQFPTIIDLMSRTVGLVTLLPKEELEGLPRMSFAGPLNPGLLSNLELRPVNYDAYALHQEFQRQRAEARRLKMNPILSFQATTGYRPLAFKGRSSAEEQSQRELLENLTAKLSSMTPLRSAQLRDLACPQMFADSEKRNSLVDRCRFHPNLLSLRVLTFVERLNSTRPKLVFIHPPDTLQMNMAFQMTDATTESVGYNLRAGLSLSPGNPLGLDILGQGRLGFNISMNGDMSWGRVVQKQNSQGVVINRSRSVTAEGVTYEIQAATRRCLILSPSEFALQNFPNQAKGLFFCSRNLNPQDRRQETYYLVNSQVGREGSVVVDNASNDPETTAFWRMMIRGNELFRLFQAVAEKPIYSLLVSRPPAEQQLNEDFKRLYQEGPTQLIPGAFVEVGE